MRPGEAIGEGTASATVEGSVFKGICREAEAWQHKESTGEDTGDSAAQFQQKTLAVWRY